MPKPAKLRGVGGGCAGNFVCKEGGMGVEEWLRMRFLLTITDD